MHIAKGLLTTLKKKVDDGPLRAPPAPRLSRGGGWGGPEVAVSSSGVVTMEARVLQFKQELRRHPIDLHSLRRLAFQGIPDRDNLRATVWKVGGAVGAPDGPPAGRFLLPRCRCGRAPRTPATQLPAGGGA